MDFRLLCILAIRDEDDCLYMQKLFLKNRELMYRTAYSIVHNLTDAEDVVSSTCLKLISKLDRLRAINPLRQRAYIRSSVRNEALMLLRRRKTERYALDHLTVLQRTHQQPPNVDTQVIYRVTLEEVMAAIGKLAEDDRDVLRMKFFDQLADVEIAEIFGVSQSTVRSKIIRARQRLYAALRENADDDG